MIESLINTVIQGDCLDVMKSMPDNFVNCCVTSPPYWGLRDYGVEGQLGLEKTPNEYVEKIVNVFREVKRILKKDGTLWLNLGDSYNSTDAGKNPGGFQGKQMRNNEQMNNAYTRHGDTLKGKIKGLKPKDLVGIPWRVAFALQADGWYLRQDIIWSKPNPMPESVTDRCTKSHEYIFLMAKSERYYFNQESIRTPLKDISIARLAQNIESQKGSDRVPFKTNGNMKAVRKQYDKSMAGGGSKIKGHNGYFDEYGNLICGDTANKKSVWTITTKPFKEAHFATFPEDLIVPCIFAGCPEGGIVFDPFIGSGTTGVVAMKYDRNFIGIELNAEYIEMANERISELKEQGRLFTANG